jgi:hypothetical protein
VVLVGSFFGTISMSETANLSSSNFLSFQIGRRGNSLRRCLTDQFAVTLLPYSPVKYLASKTGACETMYCCLKSGAKVPTWRNLALLADKSTIILKLVSLRACVAESPQ